MKLLLISDTHGSLDIINHLVDKTNADLVIHAGDFGFYDENSYQNLSTRELYLLIKYSDFGKQYKIDRQSSKNTLIEIVKQHDLLGDFPKYLKNEARFLKPVYTVYGNHEDVSVIKHLKLHNPVSNLKILDEANVFPVFDNNQHCFNLFGLGGNFLVGEKLLRQPIAGNAGKVWATLHQFGVLYQNLKDNDLPSIFVSHVSPGKEPLLTRLIIHFMPNFWISGHMGAPYTCVWNQFTIREMDGSLNWFNSQLQKLNQLQISKATPQARLAYDLIQSDIQREEYWYKKLWNINLPDAQDGYSILNFENGRFYIETYSGSIA